MPSTFREMTAMSGRSSTILRGVVWLLLRSGRWGYFEANAAEVGMTVLLLLPTLNIGHMGLAAVRLTTPVKVERSQMG
jgi:hypothetical protein